MSKLKSGLIWGKTDTRVVHLAPLATLLNRKLATVASYKRSSTPSRTHSASRNLNSVVIIVVVVIIVIVHYDSSNEH